MVFGLFSCDSGEENGHSYESRKTQGGHDGQKLGLWDLRILVLCALLVGRTLSSLNSGTAVLQADRVTI